MSKYFSLQNLCDFEITRPVCDMAAFFDYELAPNHPAVEGEPAEGALLATISIAYDIQEHAVQATLVAGEASFSAIANCQLEQGSEPEPTSGELTRCVKLAVVAVLEQATGARPSMPWGILTGVRPGKLAHKLLDAGLAASTLPH